MDPAAALALALDPTRILRAQNLTPDPWQKDLLFSRDPYLLLNCSRQSGKSTTVAALALHEVLTRPGCLVLVVAPAERQSHELFRKVLAAYHALGRPLPARTLNRSTLELANGARLVALPGREGAIRSFSAVRLLILDEAARVPDDLYRSVRPMLAVSRGRLLALSTPFGQRGWFHDEWTSPAPFRRIHVPWKDCPRISRDFIAAELRSLGPTWVDQEYNALFTTMEGLVYPDFSQCLVTDLPDTMRATGMAPHAEQTPHAETAPSPLVGEGWGGGSAPRETASLSRIPFTPHPDFPRAVGGIDFGWRNPFAALWGALDSGNVLWITGERYLRETPIADHAAALSRDVNWYVDPAGATEIAELTRAGHVIKKGINDIRPGIALVTQRIRLGKLKVLAPACPNLINESKLYRYPTPKEKEVHGENPIDAHNHALAALRYLVTRLPTPTEKPATTKPPTKPTTPREDDDRLWPAA